MAGKNIGLTVFLMVVLVVFAGCIENEGASIQQKARIIEEIKDSSMSISYDELMVNSESYTGKVVFYRGKIVQVLEGIENENIDRSTISFTLSQISKLLDDEKEYVLLIATEDPDTDNSKNILWVKYKGKRIQNNDIVDVWGRFRGIKKHYELFLKTEITLPEIDSLYLELI